MNQGGTVWGRKSGIAREWKKAKADSGMPVLVDRMGVMGEADSLEMLEVCWSHWVHDAAIFVQSGGQSKSKGGKCPI